MANDSWTHKLARACIRPLLGTAVTPNHLTALRVLSGVAACAAFASGDAALFGWGAVLWVLSAFLDRADGELARIGNLSSPGGHLFDYYADVGVNALFFAAIGIGLRDSDLGNWAILMGLVGGISIVVASVVAERFERQDEAGRKPFSGVAGFDFDDVLYLLGPAIWLGAAYPLLVASAVVIPIFALISWWRVRKLAMSAAGN
ncbi:MAG: CDP-alcohol phosphatidyltransferase family protein [Alphaproteobacteria bacterium]|nr:CDP-alcohol phosphatidyltransferase family protein [Alphaproteobacteria bacterium]